MTDLAEVAAAVAMDFDRRLVRLNRLTAINDWHKMAAEALSEWENKA